MKRNRRDFIKASGLAGLGLAGGVGIVNGQAAVPSDNGWKGQTAQQRRKHFNMSGYAAPRIETVRIGFVGLGNRGPGAVNRMSKIDDTLKQMGLEPERVMTYEVAITDVDRVPKLIDDYAAKILEIGMSPLKGFA